MDAEDKILTSKFSDIKVSDLKNYFNDMFTLRDLCDDFIELFKREEKYYLDEERYNMLLEDEARMVDDLHQITEEIRNGYEDILSAFYNRRIDRERQRLTKAFKEIEKKPKQPQEKDN
ncbi:hypothetical protein EDI_082050 [Entamoeba dispar SAW760]|uniref:Uncharacterized protein n=1 Tax=Entamoeba dispar (strain ATCC PRA-260 / SAW760) TaxID=370354 RepID=B0ELM1_ENTDS|nr:uncharacterized protein EDI_082050 [Entamoeba dispar SAW760]EDR24580.1 hypothetical protein EDI_082050 [Entamoeba dispar SAW760]|eukprot:EDR24580.1 hypothetical protein EDI_082050 [Entamoeba dispar SAW760]